MKKLFFTSILCLVVFWGNTQTFTEQHDIQCNDSILVGPLGYPTWNIPTFVELPAAGYAELITEFPGGSVMNYKAPPAYAGLDTVVVACAHATQITCDTGIYVFNIGCPLVIEPVFFTQVPCNDSVYVANLSGWFAPQIAMQALHGASSIVLEPTDGAGVKYVPNPGFVGLDFVLVSLFNQQQTYMYVFQVYCNLTTGVQDLSIRPLMLYPNPGGDVLYFDSSEPVDQIMLINAMGVSCKLPFDQTQDGHYMIKLGAYPAGVYYLIANSGSERLAGKFIKR